eukprot:3286309-Alexandrium_andersonii.AAC.1
MSTRALDQPQKRRGDETCCALKMSAHGREMGGRQPRSTPPTGANIGAHARRRHTLARYTRANVPRTPRCIPHDQHERGGPESRQTSE